VNVTHFVENLNRGGLERAVIDLIRAQVALGYSCQVVCLFERGTLADELGDFGVPVHTCGKRRGFDTKALARARRHLKAHATEVLHTHNATAHYHAVLAALGLPIRSTINTRHGMGALDSTSRREWLYRRSLFLTDAVVTVCEAAKRELRRNDLVPAAKLVAIANGIRVERFAAADAPTRARLVSALGLSPGTRLIGTVGRLARAKNHAGLIAAFANVAERIPDCALVIVGDGELRSELAAQVRGLSLQRRVFLLGDRDDVGDLLCGFDIFAMSSLTEGYSIALLEACAAGLPIVATDVGGNSEIVHEGINGKLVPAGSSAPLAQALCDLLEDRAGSAEMGRHGRAWALEQGSFTAMAARYDALYAQFSSKPTATN
jgi:glycosyltransferase involved in cell wall biosynthesis